MQKVLLIAALALFALGGFLSYSEKVGSATATYSAAVISLVFVFLNDFRSFKAFGIEAELREKIQEADTLLTQLRSLIAPISELLFTMVARGGRWDSGIPRKDSLRLMSQIEAQLAQLGVPETDIEKLKKEWHQFNLLDLAKPIFDDISEAIHVLASERTKALNQFPSPITPEWAPEHAALAEASRRVASERERLAGVFKLPDKHNAYKYILQFIESTDLFSEREKADICDRNKEAFEDLCHYADRHEFRRLDVWLTGD